MADDSRSNVSPFDGAQGWRRRAGSAANACAVIAVAPLALLARFERQIAPRSEGCFQFFAQLLAGVPGYPGVVLRRAYYWWTLEQCSLQTFVGYGAYFAHRMARVGDHVYIGPYAVVGAADIGTWAMIGTRASLLSGSGLHALDESGRWLPSDLTRMTRIHVGAHTWIGEGAILMADVGYGANVAVGAVVSTPVREGVLVAGNPARFVRNLHPGSAVESR